MHAPLSTASRKQQKILSKPWLSKRILPSIRRKQKMHKSFYIHGSKEQKIL